MKKIFIITLFLFSFVLVGCKNKNQYDNKDIIASSYFSYDIAKNISKEKLSVGMLSKPGEDMHNIQYTSSMIKAALKAKLLLVTSNLFDHQLKEIQGYKDANAVDLFSKLYPNEENTIHHEHDGEESEHEHHHEHAIVHYFVSPSNFIKLIDIVLSEIISIDKANESYYSANATEYKNKISAEIAALKKYLDSQTNKQLFFMGHNAFELFEEEFGLEIINLNDHIKPDALPESAELKDFITKINELKPKAILVPELEENKDFQTTIKSDAGLLHKDFNYLELHSFHNVSKNDFDNNITYLDLFQRNIKNIKQALN